MSGPLRLFVFLMVILLESWMSFGRGSIQADERQWERRFTVEESAASHRLIAVYVVADLNSKERSSMVLRIPGQEETTIEVEPEPILLPKHFSRLEVEPVFPDKHTVSVSLTRAGAQRYSEFAEDHLGRQYIWVVDGVARTKSSLRYPTPGAGYGVDIDENKEQSRALQGKLKAVLAERPKAPPRETLPASEWDGKAVLAASAPYLAFLLNAHQQEDGWVHPGTLYYLHEAIVKQLAANPVDPRASALHALRRSMERCDYLRPNELGALLDRVADVDPALLSAAQGRENWLNLKFGDPPKRVRPMPPPPKSSLQPRD